MSEGRVTQEPVTAVVVREEPEGALQRAFGAFAPAVVREQINLVQQVMKDAMKDGEHFGKIPGCGDKPTLLKAGAEKLCFTFRLSPEFEVDERDLGNGHREYRVTCRLVGINSGKVMGCGVGSCSTMESKYRWRTQERKCPTCGAAAIIKGKEEYGGGWLCWPKKGGCNAKYSDVDARITSQPTGRTENPDIADTYNTVLKMAKKRAHVDATLTATAASDIFTQDVEDGDEYQAPPARQYDAAPPPPPAQGQKQRTAAPKTAPAPAPPPPAEEQDIPEDNGPRITWSGDGEKRKGTLHNWRDFLTDGPAGETLWIIPFGRLCGQMIGDITEKDLESLITFLTPNREKTGYWAPLLRAAEEEASMRGRRAAGGAA